MKTAVISIVGFLIAVFLFFTVGPMIEQRFLPVVYGTPLFLDRDDQVTHLAVFGKKLRACTLLGIYADIRVNDRWVRGDIRFKDLATNKYIEVRASRNNGAQLWDVYEVKPVGDEIRAIVVERCHPFWESNTEFFTLNVKNAEREQAALRKNGVLN